jgi:hypothetical protein
MLWEITPEKKVIWKFALRVRSGMEEGLMEGMKMSYNTAKVMYYPTDYEGVVKLFSRLKDERAGEIRPSQTMRFFPRICFNLRAERIDFFNVTECKIRIYTLQGKVSASASPGTNRLSMSVNNLPKGIYLIRIDSRLYGIVNEIMTVL